MAPTGFEEQIKNYGDSITHIENFTEAVQKRPGMYLGETGKEGAKTCIKEILSNGIDEILKMDSPADTLWLTFNERTQTFTCRDNGRGLPFDKIIDIMTQSHTSSNFERKPFEFPSGLHGIGAKVVNAMSEKMVVESYVLGEAVQVQFYDGKPWDQGIVKIPCEGRQGTSVTFTPNPKFMGRMDLTVAEVKEYISATVRFTKKGSTIHYKYISLKGKVDEGTIINDGGVEYFLTPMVKNPLTKPVHIYDNTTGTMMMDLLFVYDTADMVVDQCIRSFVNTNPTTAGYHIIGTYDGICSWFVKHMNQNYLAAVNAKRKKPLKCITSDVKTGLKIALSCAHIEPIFDGQAKNRFAISEFAQYASSTIMKQMDEWAKAHPTELNKICDYLKGVINIRMSADNEKEKLNLANVSAVTHFPSKYVDATGKTGLELYLMEGDSAGGTMRNHRINATQAYFPLRGKTKNPFGVTPANFLKNEEISGLIQIIGAGWGRNFDLSKCRFEKIVIMTDADVDGDHITTLLIRFFAMYMPGLIESGRLYIACPPLYGYKQKKQTVYLQNMTEYIQLVQREFVKKYEILHADGRPFKGNSLSEFLIQNEGYTSAMSKPISLAEGSDDMIELVLRFITSGLPADKFEAFIKEKYQFSEVNIVNGMTVVNITDNGRRHALFINDIFIQLCTAAIKYIRNNTEFEFIVNGKRMSLIGLMKLFDSFRPAVTRYKGLGEMDGEALFESTINPENRTFIQVTLENQAHVLSRMTDFDNNMKQTLMNTVATRLSIT